MPSDRETPVHRQEHLQLNISCSDELQNQPIRDRGLQRTRSAKRNDILARRHTWSFSFLKVIKYFNYLEC